MVLYFRHNKRMTTQEKTLHVQDLDLRDPPAAATQPLPPNRQLFSEAGRHDHTYVLRDDMAGQAKKQLRRTEDADHLLRSVPTPSVEVEVHSTLPDAALPEATLPDAPQPVYLLSTEPVSTAYRHKMREAMGFVPVNKRKRARNHCATCGHPKTKETGHSCLYGYVFCPENVEGLTIAQWRARVLSNRNKLHSTLPDAAQPKSILPDAPQPVYLLVVSGLATDIRPGVPPGVNFPDVTATRPPVSTEPISTAYRHKMRDSMGFVPVNKRKRARNHCATCVRPKTKDTGHSCLYGYVFCPENVEGLTIAQWRARVLSNRNKSHSTLPDAAQPKAILPDGPQPVYLLVVSGLATDIRPGVPPGVNVPDVTATHPPVSTEPVSTAYRHKMREAMGLVPVNKRRRARNHCGTCGHPKIKQTGHSCLYGYVFCPENVEGLTIAQWRARVLSNRNM